MIFIIFALIQIHVKPYEDPRSDKAEMISLMAVIFTVWLGGLLSHSTTSTEVEKAASILIVLVNVLAVLWLVAMALSSNRALSGWLSLDSEKGAAAECKANQYHLMDE